MSLRTSVKKTFDRIVYSSAFLNRVLRNLNKALSGITRFRLRPYGTLTVRLKSGIKFNMATNETSSVTKLLFWNTPDKYEYTSIFEPLSKKCGSFLDIGSNTGYYSLLAARANPQIKVWAFEPAAAPYYYLEKNIQLNGLGQQIKAFKLALSDRQGQVEFYEVQSGRQKYNLAGSGTMAAELSRDPLYIPVQVPSTTLDRFAADEHLPSIDLVKMDTEGTEHFVLSGSHQVLAMHKPIIICETLFQVIEKELEDIFGAHGYSFYQFKAGRLHKTDRITRETDNGVRDCFFVHPEKVALIKDFIA